MRDLQLIQLKPGQVPQAYPLIQAVRPALTLEQWQTYANDILAKPDRGIATLQNAGSLIFGLFVYCVDSDPDHGRLLRVEDFVALDIIGAEAVAESLAQGMETLARRFGCTAVHTAIASGEGAAAPYLLEVLRELGHRLESFQLCKSLAATGSSPAVG